MKKTIDERALEMAEICHLLTFRRLPVECDAAGDHWAAKLERAGCRCQIQLKHVKS